MSNKTVGELLQPAMKWTELVDDPRKFLDALEAKHDIKVKSLRPTMSRRMWRRLSK